MRCDAYQQRMLEGSFGLLDPAEAESLRAHTAACPACIAAAADVAAMRGKIGRAAKLSFANVTFNPQGLAAVPHVAAKSDSRRRPAWLPWAVAAGLLLAVGGLNSQVLRDAYEYQRVQSLVREPQAKLKETEQKRDEVRNTGRSLLESAAKTATAAKQSRDEIVEEWVAAAAVPTPSKAIAIQVTGPTAAIPGAPNDYTIDILDATGQKTLGTVRVVVRNSRGTVYFDKSHDTSKKLQLLASFWAKLPAGAEDIVLSVTATDANGAKIELAEPIRLLAPVFNTFLTTDKPLYRPGEPVYFRSLTLDRAHHQPPTKDYALRFDVKKPDGSLLAGVSQTGNTMPVMAGTSEPVPGPDGKPVRGIACGSIVLPADLPGGEYALTATDTNGPTTPVAVRKFVVQAFTPHKLLKTLEFDKSTYGPGEVVSAKLTVRDQGKPVVGAQLLATVQPATLKILPEATPIATAADGTTTIRFTLPAGELKDISLSVNVLHPHNEVIVRPVPLVQKSLTLEFFPEGGDLIAGVSCRVYFRATTPAGAPADLDGAVMDGAAAVARLKTRSDSSHPGANQGLGVFTLTPMKGKRYTVKLDRPLGVDAAKFILPAVKADGVTMTITDGVLEPGRPIAVTLHATAKKELLLGAYTRGLAIAHQRVTVEPGQPTVAILPVPADAVGGVVRVTAFELDDRDSPGHNDLAPVAERLIFRRSPEALNLKVSTGVASSFSPGDKVKLEIAATTETGRPTPAILWAAVVNQSVLTLADDRTERLLPTHFLLAGEVQSPDKLEHADFFLTRHPKAAESLDLLLGTQGWRRFTEQTGRFQSTTDPADGDRFLISTGMTPTRHDVPKSDPLAEKYLPSFKESAAKLTVAEREAKAVRDEQTSKQQVLDRDHAKAEDVLATVADSLPRMTDREEYAPSWWLGGAGLGLLLLAAGYAAWRGLRVSRTGVLLAAVLAVAAYAGIALLAPMRNALAKLQDDAQPLRFLSVGAATRVSPPSAARTGRTMVESGSNALPVRGSVAANLPVDRGRDVSRRVSGATIPTAESSIVRTDVLTGRTFKEGAEAVARVKKSLEAATPFIAREYAHPRPTSADGNRSDFTETVLWHPLLVLPGDGRGSVEFHLSDDINACRVLVAGHTLDGRLGASTSLIEVRKPLAVDVKLPGEISSTDKLHLPLSLTNGTALGADIAVNYWSDFLPTSDDPDLMQSVSANTSVRRMLSVSPSRPNGVATVRLGGRAGAYTDAVERKLTIVPDGFPASGGVNGRLAKSAAAKLTLPEQIVPGSLGVTLTVYTNPAADVVAGIAGLLREPHGCFEQTSSANYPNLLVLDYLKQLGKPDSATADRAHQLLETGYRRLIGFEVPKPGGKGREGFEWFGAYPPHEGLTAYGLVQFADLAKVHPVEEPLVLRTRDYLLSRRDGNGGFQRKADTHQFGNGSAAVANAYITWAITEADAATDVKPELAATAKEAVDSGDPYRLALVATALLNVGATENAAEMLKRLASKQLADGSVPGAQTTITQSTGADLVTETTALAAVAWLLAKSPEFATNAAAAVQHLLSRRTPQGTFGATQATVLALRALSHHAAANRKPAESGVITVKLNERILATVPFRSDDFAPTVIHFPDADRLFNPGSLTLTIESTAKEAYPFSLAWTAAARKPTSDASCPVALTATLDKPSPKEGETVRLTVTMTNTTDAPHGMAVAIVGVPAGLKLPEDGKQLAALTAAGTIAHWERRGRDLVFYWRDLGPKQVVAFPLDVIADIPGESRGPAGRAYLYYAPQAKAWIDPLHVAISPAL